MLFELIAAVVAGIAVAGIAMTLRWLSRGRLPRWIVPASAGLGMLCYAIWSEYTWFERMVGTQPASVVVAWHNETRSVLRPWSFYRPVVTRFTAVDKGSAQRHANFPDQVMVDLVLSARWQQAVRVKVVFDCAGRRRADLMQNGVSIGADGAIIGATWTDLPENDPVLAVACERS